MQDTVTELVSQCSRSEESRNPKSHVAGHPHQFCTTSLPWYGVLRQAIDDILIGTPAETPGHTTPCLSLILLCHVVLIESPLSFLKCMASFVLKLMCETGVWQMKGCTMEALDPPSRMPQLH